MLSIWKVPFVNKVPARIISVGQFSEMKFVSDLKLQDHKAYFLLYRKYGPSLYGIIRKKIKCPVISEDALQEAFIKISRNINSYDPEKGRFYTWLARIAKNAAIDQLRCRSARQSCKYDEIDQKIDQIPEHLNCIFDVDTIGLKDLIKTLDPIHQAILDLVYYKGYTHNEAAEELKIPIGTLKTRWRYSMISLRHFFNV